LRHRICRQSRPCPPHGRGGGRHALRQHLERLLLSQCAAAAGRFPGGTGGSGIALYHDALFAEENGRILRYRLTPGTALPIGPPTAVLSGLPLTGDHPMHPFVIDANGELFVDLGSATNSCQFENRIPNSPGHKREGDAGRHVAL
jgi:hypothetical protein